MRKLVSNIREGDRVAGTAVLCKACRLLFIGRDDALFCSDACRQAGYRGRIKAIERRLDRVEARAAATDNSYSSLRPGEPWAS